MYKYEHGGDIYATKKSCIDFSANINPLGMPTNVKQALRQAAGHCEAYPDPFCRELTRALAVYWQINKNNILCGNGAADLLFKLALALRSRKTLLLAPTFADYEKALRVTGSEFVYYTLKEENSFVPGADILDYLTEDVDLVVICNPNNPTGKTMPQDLLEYLLIKANKNNTKVLVDECFMEFVGIDGYSLIPSLNRYQNLIILRAFTKIYAMAGVRLGYLMTADSTILDACRINSQDWSVSTLAQEAGLAALQNKEYLIKTQEYVKQEREYLIKNLHAVGIPTYGSEANFILFKVNNIRGFGTKMAKVGILVRSCANYHGLTSSFYRIAVRNRKDNRIFVKKLKELLE